MQAQHVIYSNPPPKLLDQVREILYLKHYSRSTEKTYVFWIRRYILFHQKRHPQEMGELEIEESSRPFGPNVPNDYPRC